MPKKNTQGGKKFKRGKVGDNILTKRELVFATEEQVYGHFKILKQILFINIMQMKLDNLRHIMKFQMMSKLWIMMKKF
jgi:hypothetical protein